MSITYAFPSNGAGGGGGGASSVDESDFNAGISTGTPIMGEYDGELLVLACNAARQLQLSATFTPPTASTSTNTLVTAGTSSSLGLASNASRIQVTIQNAGTTQIYVLKGAGTASATNFSYILPAGGTTKDGSSRIVTDAIYKGAYQVASSAAGGLVVFGEDTP